MLEILVFLLLGCFAGIFTGLIPGLHVNTVVAGLLLFAPLLVESFGVYCVAAFVIGNSVMHTFVDFIPSILLGAPEESTAISVLPGHVLLRQGRAYEAIALTAVGGVYAAIFSLISLPLLFYLIDYIYATFRRFVLWILLAISSYMIISERKRLRALAVFMISGAFGMLAMNHPAYSLQDVLFPALSGLFGLSTLLISLRFSPKLPAQTLELSPENYTKAGFGGFLAGLLAGFLPAIGSAQSAYLLRGVFGGDLKGFLVAQGGVNTAEAMFSIFALYLIGSPRSGASVALKRLFPEVQLQDFLIFVSLFAISLPLCLGATLHIAKVLIINLDRAEYSKISLLVILFVVLMVYLLSGVSGMGILALSTTIGIFAASSGVKRSHCMGFLMIPTILYYF